MDKVRVGIVGIGNIGTAHANTLFGGEINGADLVAVCDILPERREFCKNSYNGVAIFDDYKKMFSSGLIDAVIVSTPHKLHCDIATDALNSGLNVLVEKPIDITVSKAKAINQLAAKSNKKFAIMFNQRTNDVFVKARELIKSGALGELKRTVWIITNWYRTQHYYNSAGWRATWVGEGGGVLLNQAPHNLDLWQWICGMPESVTAFCDVAKYHRIEVEDDATLFTRYKNGATGVFMTSTGEYPGTNRLEISGDLGKLVLENGVLKHYILKEPISRVIEESEQGFAQIAYDYEEIKQDKPEAAHMGILQNFANAVLHGEKLISPGIDGINELTLSNAAYLSQWQGNISVHLPFDCALYDRLLAERANFSQSTDADIASASGGHTSYLPRWQVRW